MKDTHQHFSGKLAQKAIIEENGKILLCRGIGDNVWDLPGGRLHTGETPQEGLARELLEELRLVIKVGQLVYLCTSFHFKDKSHQLFVAYACSVISGTLMADPDEIEEMCWMPYADALSMPLFDVCHAALEAYGDLRHLPTPH